MALTFREKVFVGGLGALTPIVVNMLTIDLERVFSNITLAVALGYALRVTILFYLGGLVALLHRDEQDRLKLFELGIVAPAYITTFLNAQAGKIEEKPSPGLKEAHYNTSVASFSFMDAAYADERPAQAPAQSPSPLPSFSAPTETTSEQILRGFLGTTSGRVWFVVVGSFSSLDNARQYEAHVNKYWKNFNAEVYAPYDTPYYPVVIGANLTIGEAIRLRNKAMRTGIVQGLRKTYTSSEALIRSNAHRHGVRRIRERQIGTWTSPNRLRLKFFGRLQRL
jgi:hypothetical protein